MEHSDFLAKQSKQGAILTHTTSTLRIAQPLVAPCGSCSVFGTLSAFAKTGQNVQGVENPKKS
jgi:hypothetical protein